VGDYWHLHRKIKMSNSPLRAAARTLRKSGQGGRAKRFEGRRRFEKKDQLRRLSHRYLLKGEGREAGAGNDIDAQTAAKGDGTGEISSARFPKRRKFNRHKKTERKIRSETNLTTTEGVEP